MKYHKCHLKIKVGTRTEDRVAAGIINFNLIFSSEPTDSGPIDPHLLEQIFALNASKLQCWPSESKFQIAPCI